MTNYQRSAVQTVDDIRAIADHAGSFFFSPETMRCFNSRVLSGVFPSSANEGNMHEAKPGSVFYFVTSERHGDDAPRHYAVRRLELGTVRDNRPSADISTVGEYLGSARAARDAAKVAADVAADAWS